RAADGLPPDGDEDEAPGGDRVRRVVVVDDELREMRTAAIVDPVDVRADIGDRVDERRRGLRDVLLAGDQRADLPRPLDVVAGELRLAEELEEAELQVRRALPVL